VSTGNPALDAALAERARRQGGAAAAPAAPARPTATIPYPKSRALDDASTASGTTFRDNVQTPNVNASTAETMVDTRQKELDLQRDLEARARREDTARKGLVAVDAGLQAIRGARDNINTFSTGTVGGLIGKPDNEDGKGGTGLSGLPILGDAIYGNTDKSALDSYLQTVQAGLTYDFLTDLRKDAAASGGSSAGIANTNLAEFLSLGTTQANVFGAQKAGPDDLTKNLDIAEEQLLRRKAALLVPTSELLNASPEQRKALLDAAYERAKQEYLGPKFVPSGGGQGGGIATGDTRRVADPALAGVNAAAQKMIREGASAADIVSFVTKRGVPLSDTLISSVQANVAAYRPYVGKPLPETLPEPVVDLETRQEDLTLRQKIAGNLADSNFGALTIGAANGFTLGGLDEIASMGDPKRQQEIQLMKDYLGQNYGAAYTGGNILGGAANAIPIGRGVSIATKGLSPVVQRILAGGTNVALGATGGALESNEDRKGGALLGATLALGGDLAGNYIGGKLAPKLAAEPNAAESAIAASVTDPAVNRGALAEAERLGVPMSMADSSPALRNLAGQSVRNSESAGILADTAIGGRDATQVNRAIATVERTLATETNVPKAAKTLRGQGSAAADPYYKAAYGQVGIATDPEIKAILARPDVAEGLQEAQRTLANRGRDWKELGFSINKNGRVTVSENATFEALDLVKRGIDTVLRKPEYRDAFGRLNLKDDATRAIVDAQEALVARMRTLNGDYAQALDTYAPFARNAEALEMGGNAITNTKATPAELAEIVADMDPEQLANYQIGAANAIINKVKKAKDNTDAFSVFRSEDMRQRLAAVFPDKAEELANLKSVTDLEGTMRRTKEALLGGSATQGRQVAQEAFAAQANPGGILSTAVEAGTAAATNGVSLLPNLVRGGLLSFKNANRLQNVKNQEALAADLAPILLETDPKKAKAALDAILSKVDTYDRVRKTARGVGGSAATGASMGILAD
jgi:hypothetical protein